ncbi:hypothetical protein M758_2G116500 [Ceratodon purpureus]|nr:hypothetical protein M758_2G116500 [Ceratodon purpureus]
MASLDCLAPKGMLVSLGATGGDAPMLNFKDLAGKESLTVVVPVLGDYVKHQEEILEDSFGYDKQRARCDDKKRSCGFVCPYSTRS